MIGQLKVESGAINGTISSTLLNCSVNCDSLNASVGSATISCTMDTAAIVGNIVVESLVPYYDEPYSVTPKVNEFKLSTRGKAMSEDLVINPIPFYETSNEFGHTIYIGGE